MNLCERCGRDLDLLGMYADLVHFRADNLSVPCLELSELGKLIVDAETAYFMKRMAETIGKGLSE